METTLTLKLTGIRDMIMHNGRLANPLDKHTRAVAAIAKKRNKTDSDRADLALLEARGGMYETPEGLIGLPVPNVWRCIYDAAKAFKLGKSVQQALIGTPDIVPILINGSPEKCDSYLRDDPDSGRLLYVPVVVMGKRTMRARPVIQPGWEATVSFILLADVLQPENLVPVIERAGRLVGLGDWRPLHGTFKAEVIK